MTDQTKRDEASEEERRAWDMYAAAFVDQCVNEHGYCDETVLLAASMSACVPTLSPTQSLLMTTTLCSVAKRSAR